MLSEYSSMDYPKVVRAFFNSPDSFTPIRDCCMSSNHPFNCESRGILTHCRTMAGLDCQSYGLHLEGSHQPQKKVRNEVCLLVWIHADLQHRLSLDAHSCRLPTAGWFSAPSSVLGLICFCLGTFWNISYSSPGTACSEKTGSSYR